MSFMCQYRTEELSTDYTDYTESNKNGNKLALAKIICVICG
jgi:hypothetical protein